ncbi:CpXC domain-containing protein [Streptomyces gilvus]|uniref:CpXC domain-containing protein n=1 Tax=Streptomyces gilvus TaxID=2920937 RepID=UPI001F0D5EA3|nr:CpXC domain-containing protein [Streptomyces sp. CME 23]MCH5674187.1 CpXC domain-containing protein [Streptomyces sp. CME 23]
MSESSVSDVRGMSVAAAFAGMRSVAPVVFKAGCPDCRGSFELTANALRLAIGASSRSTFYSFTCPDCGAAVRKPAGERIVELLTGGGVRTLRLHTP